MCILYWYRKAWGAYKSNLRTIIPAMLVVLGLNTLSLFVAGMGIGSYVLSILESPSLLYDYLNPSVLSIVLATLVIFLLISSYVSAFKIVVLRSAYHGKDVDLFLSLREALKHTPSMYRLTLIFLAIACSMVLLLAVAVGGAGLVMAYVLGLPIPVVVAGTFVLVALFMLLMVWVFVRTFWARVYVVSDGIGAVDALRKSWALTGTHIKKAVSGFLAKGGLLLGAVAAAQIPFVDVLALEFFFEPLDTLVTVAVAEDLENFENARSE